MEKNLTKFLEFPTTFSAVCFVYRGNRTVTFDTSVKNITGYFTYKRFTNWNRFSEKTLSVITENADKITKNRFKKIFINTRKQISFKNVAEVLKPVLSTLGVIKVREVVDLWVKILSDSWLRGIIYLINALIVGLGEIEGIVSLIESYYWESYCYKQPQRLQKG